MSEDTVMSIIGMIIFLLFIIGWKFYDKLKYLLWLQNMFRKVGWIAEKDSYNMCYSESVRLRYYELISYIMQEQKKLNISKEFCIDYSNETEKQETEEILNQHKADVVKAFFCDFLAKSKVISKFNSLEYYMFSLFNFLNAPIVKGVYHDFNKTYYKLYLVSRRFCENNQKINISGGLNSKQIEKTILEFSV